MRLGRPSRSRICRGSSVVLYFYPKDDTPGCTVQACGLRDAWDELGVHANIFGVSVDSAASHEKFIKKYRLPFPLLADVDKEIVASYGVWVEKSMYGKKYMGVERSTFVIDGAGRISAIFRKVRPEEHVTIRGKGAARRRGLMKEVCCGYPHPMLALRSGKPAS